ncbi:porin [uncultured Turicimonas sp.]|uniref:porin n=1 Tax=uncultured Turicimonas sp. TaxID=1918607 RepID=UPI003211A61C
MKLHPLIMCLISALCLTAAHAEGQIKVYGIIDTGLQFSKAKHADSNIKMVSGQQSGSRWGLEGKEDLGSGNYTFFILESQFDADTGAVKNFNGETNGLFTRQSVIGLGGEYGEVMLGRMYNGSGPAGRNQTLAGADAFKTAWLDASSRSLSLENTLRLRNAIQYATPSINGWKAVGTFSLTRFKNEEAAKWTQNDRLVDLAVRYKGKKLYFMAGGNKTENAGNKTGILNFVTGGHYDFGSFKLFAGYRFGNHLDTAGFQFKGKSNWRIHGEWIGLQVPAGKGLFMTQVVHLNAKSRNKDGGSFAKTSFGLGYQYFLSKRTDVYLVASYSKANHVAKDAATENRLLTTVGMRHRF